MPGAMAGLKTFTVKKSISLLNQANFQTPDNMLATIKDLVFRTFLGGSFSKKFSFNEAEQLVISSLEL